MLAQLNRDYLKASKFKTYQRLLSYFLFEGRPLTTKGRWINPFVKIWLHFIKLVSSGKLDHAPVIIVGAGRSGTTLLGMLLSMQKEVAFINEPKIIWHLANNNDDVIGSYNKKGGTFLLRAADASQKVMSSMNRIYSGFSRLSGSKIILDKYPEVIFRIEYAEKIFPGVKFIFITRNFHDTIDSVIHWNKAKAIKYQYDKEDWWGLNDKKWKLICKELVPQSMLLRDSVEEISGIDDDISKSAAEWILTMEKGLEEMRKNNNILHVKYESLLTNPAGTLDEIFSFLLLQKDRGVDTYTGQVLKTPGTKRMKHNVPAFLESAALRLMAELGYPNQQ